MAAHMAFPRILQLDTERGWRGGQLQVLLLHRGLCRLGIDSTLLCRAGEPLAVAAAAEGLPVLTVSSGPGFALRAAWAARRFAATGSAAILHAHASAAHGIARLAVTGRREPLVATRRVDFALAPGAGKGWKYGPRTMRCAAVSQAVAKVLERGGVPPVRITVIPDGIEPVPAVPHREGLPTGRLLVLCAAAFADHKGHRFLLDAWRRIESTGIPATLLLAGRGEREAALRQQATGLQHVQFLGWRDDLPRLWASVDVAVLASVEEGLGSTLIDAQCAGVPVVATTAGGIPEVVADGASGVLVPPRDPAALAQALLQVLTEQPLRLRLGAGARTKAQDFLAPLMVQRYLDLYRTLSIPSTAT
jgi:glycosyltransferase involved in cell wall biosynthesis